MLLRWSRVSSLRDELLPNWISNGRLVFFNKYGVTNGRGFCSIGAIYLYKKSQTQNPAPLSAVCYGFQLDGNMPPLSILHFLKDIPLIIIHIKLFK